MKQLSFEGPLALPISAGSNTPNPGHLGASVWSTTEEATLEWNGSLWFKPAVAGSQTPTTKVMAKTLTYTGNLLTKVESFSDSAKTTLYRTMDLLWNNGVLAGTTTKDPFGNVISTKALTYSNGTLVDVVTT
jgi:hypothetical protein